MKAGVGLIAGQSHTQQMIDSADRFAETSMSYGYAKPMLRPRPVQLTLESTGGIWNLDGLWQNQSYLSLRLR
tara:strand:- start:584 stop:799 length:216 start_codon:yes stop_codon:yes gene_type:complete